jgi:hypothetical protein
MTTDTSAATTVADKLTPVLSDRSEAETTATFLRLRALKASFGFKPNKHDLAIALIGACILEEFDTRIRIVRALEKLGLKRSHIVIILTEYSGDDPKEHLWRIDPEGRYSLHD